ncbi:N-acetylneuraminate synthase family protein [Ferrovibrio sp.]|uniref:N-acetylneuraminate synthase family protein n=1 Tax=Ferrovibrio sp. TaxID=1917215 RepID=UPI0025C42172|nr:N-acetylneuraminate synthase family protein [Ferrovibrio sp.]MBX3456302.1 N-acetylneuraminate synthase family protein [Ferrovibrio sp.]
MFQHNQRPYIIAEIGANHNGDMELARQLVDSAKAAGADAVKFQSWDTTIFSKSVYDKNYFLGDDYRNRSDYTLKQIVEAFAMSPAQLTEMRDYCVKIGIDFSSTPFNVEQLQHLVELGTKYIKIASMDLNNPYLLKAAAACGLPVVLSTGFGSLEEIDRAVRLLEAQGAKEIVILHCISLYPPQDDEINLRNIDTFRQAFGYPVGFSDHSIGIEIPLAAMALGAMVIEKHFTLDKNMFGWDHKVSADPAELAAICRGRDRIHAALGSSRRIVGAREMQRRDEYRRSIVATRAVKSGEVFDEAMLDFRRPGTGIDPTLVNLVVGSRAARDIGAEEILGFDMLVAQQGK